MVKKRTIAHRIVLTFYRVAIKRTSFRDMLQLLLHVWLVMHQRYRSESPRISQKKPHTLTASGLSRYVTMLSAHSSMCRATVIRFMHRCDVGLTLRAFASVALLLLNGTTTGISMEPINMPSMALINGRKWRGVTSR